MTKDFAVQRYVMPTDVTDDYLERTRHSIEGGEGIELAIDRPEKLNALPVRSVDTLTEQFEGIERGDADVVTITGRGGDFCVGADLGEMDSHDAEEAVASANRLHRLVDAMRTCPLPIVAAVRGRAFGIGFVLCMASDVVVAGDGAEFGLQEVRLGIPVGGYSTALLPAIVGEMRARRWLLTGTPVSAAEAATAGFVTRAVSPDEVDDAVAAEAASFASNSATAIDLLKTQLADPVAGRDPAAVRANEVEAIRTAFAEGDANERIGEFLSAK